MPESERLLGACFPPADSVGIEQQMAQVAGGEALAALPRTTGRMPSIPLLFPTYICTGFFFFPPSAEKKKKKRPAIPSWLVFTRVNIFYVYTVRMK